MATTIMTRDEMQALAKRVLAMSTADETRVNIVSSITGNTRFAGGGITTSGDTDDAQITITSTVNGRRASSTTNLTDDDSLKRAVETSARLAKLSPQDLELVPELGPQQYQDVSASNADVSSLNATARATATEHLIAAARAPGGAMPIDPATLFVAGFLDARGTSTGIATSKGLFAYHASTDVSLSCTARTPDGTGSRLRISRRSRMDLGRSSSHRPPRRTEGTRVSQSCRDRAGPLHRNSRAARRS